MAKSLNKVQLIGNLTRDPELRYTPSGRAVCTFSIATNRSWTTESGEKREEVDFHRIVAWGKLGELCSQFLVKGRKTYVEGRLSTRNWTAQDGAQKTTTEIVIDDMILLDSKGGYQSSDAKVLDDKKASEDKEESEEKIKEEGVEETKVEAKESKVSKKKEASDEEVVRPDDIPF